MAQGVDNSLAPHGGPFTERVLGSSKMSRSIVTEALWRVAQWGVKGRLARLRPPGLRKPPLRKHNGA